MSVPEAYVKPAKPFDYLVCVNRWPARIDSSFILATSAIRCRRSASLWPTPIPTSRWRSRVRLEQVYLDAGYMLRVLYDEPCKPPALVAGPGVGLRAVVGLPSGPSRPVPGRERPLSPGTRPEEAPRLGASPARCQNASALMTSPLARVIRAFQTSRLIVFLMNRTEPSANAALKPPGCGEPAP